MNLLVTGGMGFIGSNFIQYMVNKYPNDKIVNLDLLTYAGNMENLKDVEASAQYSFVKGDIQNKQLVDYVIKSQKIDVVVNFAAESHVDDILVSQIFLSKRIFRDTKLIGSGKRE